jgi:hypothetical protein
VAVPSRRSAASWWSAAIALLFAASLDYWWWDRPPQLAWFNLPSWIYYFVGLQLALAGAIWGFGRTIWRTREGGSAPDPASGDQ